MKAANALGAKTARACDSCLRRRARWFCGADDAFLCHGCDNLVHSANQLASRHERVRLQTASSKSATSTAPHQAWHSGFTRKARTPRHNNKHLFSQQQQQRSKHEQEEEEEEEEVVFNSYLLPVVPELGSEDAGMDETEEQLLCRVPEFDPFEAELCDMYGEIRDERLDAAVVKKDDEETCDLDNFPEFPGSDMDLAEFAADVESLLESGLVGESGAQLFDCKQEDGELMEEYVGVEGQTSMVKIKDEEEVVEAVNNNNSSSTGVQLEALNWKSETTHSSSKGKIFLRLNYEDVISAWASQGCPWTTGNPPQLSSDDCWSDCLGWSGGDADQWCYGEVGRSRGQLGSGGGDRGREARVTRYREKRRTRLFAKKIRYEVRKLNAEKRPRMKGRFVKRASFVGTSTALPPAASR